VSIRLREPDSAFDCPQDCPQFRVAVKALVAVDQGAAFGVLSVSTPVAFGLHTSPRLEQIPDQEP
jgi:hypothetical protein